MTAAGEHEPSMRRDALLNRHRILDAAVVAVHREGANVPMATVAAEAGVGVGTLYRRFPTREALLDALTHRSFVVVLDNARAAEAADGTGLDRLGHFLDRTIERRDDLVLPLHHGQEITSDATRSVRDEVHRALQRIVDRGRRDGSLRDDVTPGDVIVFGAMLAQPLPATTGWDVIAHRLERIYLDGLGARARTSSSGPDRPPRATHPPPAGGHR
jgi:AcrR family transcriptional regulator